MFVSRDAYERILRRLVLSSSDRIQWITGTATGVRVASIDPSKLESVTVRLTDNTEEEIPAALVIGMCFFFLFCFVFLFNNHGAISLR